MREDSSDARGPRWSAVKAVVDDQASRAAEDARIEALLSCHVLDTDPDDELDALVRYAARLAGAPISLVSLVDRTRQWFKARVGLAEIQTDRDASFCAHAILDRGPMIVRDAREDPRFANNPLVLRDPHIVFYAGWPLVTQDGHALGSLCVIDRRPRELSATQIDGLALLARQVMLTLELRRVVSQHRGDGGVALSNSAAQAELAQFVIHDLKNPLTTVSANVAFVAEAANLEPDHRDALADAMSGVDRMRGMLSDLLDIWGAESGLRGLRAHPRRIDGARLVRDAVGHGRGGRTQVVAKVAEPSIPMYADEVLLGRLLGNLVDNARRYAPPDSVIEVTVRRDGRATELSVADTGPGIADVDKERVFEKYVQLDPGGRTGRGLGLLFCRLAAEAHGGRIWVEDNAPCGAVFRVSIPDMASTPA